MTTDLSRRSKRTLFAGLIVLLVAAAVSLPFLPRDNSIVTMIPQGSKIIPMLCFLEEARFSGQVAVSFERSENTPVDQFLKAIDGAVERMDSPLIERVVSRIEVESAGTDIAFFQQQLPSLTAEQDLADIEQRLTPESVSSFLRRGYLSLLQPGGSIALPLLQRDPLQIEQDFLARLQTLASSSGYTIEIKNGYLFSPDGLHALVVLETSAPVTDVSASRELLDAVDAALAELPAGVSADVVCGHRHAVSNEAILKRDVQRAVLAASIGFLLLFALCFRDHRAQFIFAIPLASVLLSIPLCCWITGSLSLFVLGFGVVIVGIAVDYGIHIYVALRHADDRASAWRAVVRPIVLGALTTLGVFTAFFAAGVPGYSQMAVFSIISILLSLLGALYVLPHLIKSNPPRRSGTPPTEGNPQNPLLGGVAAGRGGYVFFAFWLVVVVALLLPFPRISFDGDLQALDGSDPSVWNAEERFRSIWGRGAESLAMVVIDAADAETALDLNDTLYDAVRMQGDVDEFSSFSSVWKSKKHRAENLNRWRTFWTPQRVESLRNSIADQGAEYGFKPDAFAPFFQTLEISDANADAPENSQIFDNLKSRFTQSLHSRFQIVSFFPDTEEWMSRVRRALDGSDALLISRREINRVLSDGTMQIVRRVAFAAVALVVLFTVLLMRRPQDSFLALLPAAFSVPAVLKLLEIFSMPINIATMISGIIVIGLSIDYGIFLVFGCRRGTLNDVFTAVTLSTVTTLIGAGVLLLTRHPALFSIGVTLVAGITVGYITAMCAIPFLFSKPWKKTTQTFQPLEK